MRILYIEPYDAGSHATFTRTVTGGIAAQWTVLTLPGRHWKWRVRGAPARLVLAHADALARPHDLLVCSSYLALAELVGLCPALGAIPRVLYFHENQLAYPVRDGHTGERDFHFGFSQMVSALSATRCLFNSHHNLDSFLAGAAGLLSRMPDAIPPGFVARIRERSSVTSFPLDLPDVGGVCDRLPADRGRGPLILWNHRWEHDKGPEAFFAAVRHLVDRGIPFEVAVCGQQFRQIPEVFDRARTWLGDRVVAWGRAPRDRYEAVLGRAQLVVSTATHEFFGVSVLEATHFGARPVVPDRLSYRELFPDEYRHGDDEPLGEVLADLATRWVAGDIDLRRDRSDITRPHLSTNVLPRLRAVFRACVDGA